LQTGRQRDHCRPTANIGICSTGIVFDETGDRLSPSHAKKDGKPYWYYLAGKVPMVGEFRQRSLNRWSSGN
jgi:hypothetical protein